MTYKIVYHKKVLRDDIPKISKDWRNIIQKEIEEKLSLSPQIFGKPLRLSLKGFRKLRVGDYRIVFIVDHFVVKIFSIDHRSIVYDVSNKRL